MAERVEVITQKRLAKLYKLVNSEGYNVIEARLRLDRVRVLYHAYEEMHDELVISKQDIKGQEVIDGLNNAFYQLAAKIEGDCQRINQTNINATASSPPVANSTFLEKQRQQKLPTTELPKFSGDVGQWLSFKNSFKAMIDRRTDISDLVKLLYLKDCLVGEAANKVNIYEASEENYLLAWRLLTESYERKRVLVAKHLDAIFDVSAVTRATSKNLAELVDGARQHVHMLKSLNYDHFEYTVVRRLEKALPDEIRLKWEESLGVDEIPGLQKFYDFVRGVSSRLGTLEREAEKKIERGGKRPAELESFSSKKKKGDSGSRVLATTITKACVQCQGNHYIYRCPVFEQLTTQERWDSIKSKQLCRNCLRKHAGDCKSGHCKKCNRFHNTLLHSTKPTTPTTTTNSIRPETTSKDKANSA